MTSLMAPASEKGWLWRPKWFLITRFMAITCVVAVILAARYLFEITTLDFPCLWTSAAMLFLSNLLYVAYYKSGHLNTATNSARIEKRLATFTMVQINTDLILLTWMLHCAGGATNPFILYYFFHCILSSILLPRKSAYFEATVAVVLFSSMTFCEGYGVIPHYDLFNPGYYSSPLFVTGMIFAVSSALYIAVYMATSIMERLRIHQVELEHALEEQRRLEEEKSRFLDVVAHDLKSPVAAIETMVTSALAVHKDKMSPEVITVLERIPVRTKGLIRFIQDLLEFSRLNKIEPSGKQHTPLNFLPIVSTTVEMNMAQALDKKIDVKVESDPGLPQIMGNREHLERMVGNLVSNAVRYTRENGSVTVKVIKQNNSIVLTVADTGIGIPEDALPHIFTDFFRADNAKHYTSSGTGLGMSITKTIVQQHGGKISVTSEEGEGTVFTVTLPAS